jgi:hypothetical protein
VSQLLYSSSPQDRINTKVLLGAVLVRQAGGFRPSMYVNWALPCFHRASERRMAALLSNSPFSPLPYFDLYMDYSSMPVEKYPFYISTCMMIAG